MTDLMCDRPLPDSAIKIIGNDNLISAVVKSDGATEETFTAFQHWDFKETSAIAARLPRAQIEKFDDASINSGLPGTQIMLRRCLDAPHG